jgi:DNA-directed RNA polymerase subunit RPC12/RpoP
MGELLVKAFKCERCGHVWVPQSEERPRVCPKCKSPYWDKPRKADWEKRVKAKLVQETKVKRPSR